MNFSDAVIDALGELDDELVAEIYEPKKKKRGAVIGALALAACAAIIIVGSGLLKDPPQLPDSTDQPGITQGIEETQNPETTQPPTSQPTTAPQPEEIRLVINHGAPVRYYTAKTVWFVELHYEGDADADADDDADADADADNDADDDKPEKEIVSISYEEIMSIYGISLDVRRALPNYSRLDAKYYLPEDVYNNVFEYSDGSGNLIISIFHAGDGEVFNSEGMTATNIHGTSVIAVENNRVYTAKFSKGGLNYFIRANMLTENEFTKLLEVLV